MWMRKTELWEHVHWVTGGFSLDRYKKRKTSLNSISVECVILSLFCSNNGMNLKGIPCTHNTPITHILTHTIYICIHHYPKEILCCWLIWHVYSVSPEPFLSAGPTTPLPHWRDPALTAFSRCQPLPVCYRGLHCSYLSRAEDARFSHVFCSSLKHCGRF